MMVSNPFLLVVGGTGRNVGKTEFVCRLIDTFSQCSVIGLKISAVYPDEMQYHGSKQDNVAEQMKLFEETNRDGSKDTSRMLRAGAKRVFFINCDGSAVEQEYHRFVQMCPENSLIICESNSLASYVTPGLFCVVRSIEGSVKPRSEQMLAIADLIVHSDGRSGFQDLNKIAFNREKGWLLR